MTPGERGFTPPPAVGEPYRADPAGPAPFLTEDDRVPVVPVEPAPYAQPGPPYGHPPSHSPEFQSPQPSGQPVFRQPGPSPAQARPDTPEERYAKVAFWVGIASIFVFNVILGPIAVVMGIMSIRKGEKRLGQLALLFGALGTFIGVLVVVLVAKGVIPTFDEMLQDLKNGKR